MKKIIGAFLCTILLISGCTKNEKKLNIGDSFSISGVLEYCNEPSDIGEEYCFVKGNDEIKYTYIDIYEEESEFISDTFYTKGDDTNLLKKYVGKKVKLTGIFDAEAHGIPYITDVKIKVEDEYLKTEIENVSIKISDVSESGAILTIKDENDEPYLYGEWYKIEKKTNDEWCDVGTIIDEYGFNMLGYMPNKEKEIEFEIDWEWLYGKLFPGHYRILKDVEGQSICAEFII